MAEQWLSIVEYARTYQVSDMTVRRRIKTGKLHAVLKEGKYFIPVSGDVRVVPEDHDDEQVDHLYNDGSHRVNDQSRRGQKEMSGGSSPVMKGHPSAHRTMGATSMAQIPTPQPAQSHQVQQRQVHTSVNSAASSPARYEESERGDAVIPSSLRRPLAAQDTSMVDTRALLAFCEASMRKFSELERRQVERFKGKLEALESTLARKDMEIQTLRQQVEDLQLLASTLERRMNDRGQNQR